MNELIKIEELNKNQDGVRARELYYFLELDKSNISRWLLKNIESDDFFVENKDYIGFVTMTNGNKIQDYIISIDMAKELSMLARNEKGKIARQYFISCEKKLENSFNVPTTFKEALLLAVEQQEKIEQQEEKLKLQAPKVDFYDTIAKSVTWHDMDEVAKLINIKGFGRNKIYEFLRFNSIIMKNNRPYQSYSENGYFKCITNTYEDNNGLIRETIKTVVSSKGIDFILKLYKKCIS